LFGLAGWVIERFTARRKRLHQLQYEATRLREKPVLRSLLLVTAANVLVFCSIADAAMNARLTLGAAIVFAQCALGTSMIAFGGLNWALDWAASPVAAVLRLDAKMKAAGALPSGSRRSSGLPSAAIRFRNVTFAYPGSNSPVLSKLDLTIPAGSSLAIVGRNGAGKTTLAKLLCRLYDPQSGTIEVDGTDIRSSISKTGVREWLPSFRISSVSNFLSGTTSRLAARATRQCSPRLLTPALAA
jgi:ABC-type multidrug transport system fused ATPase/permease subunit